MGSSQEPQLIHAFTHAQNAPAEILNSFFEKGCRKKVCTRQSRMVIILWDMTNTLFLTTVAVKPTFVAFL